VLKWRGWVLEVCKLVLWLRDCKLGLEKRMATEQGTSRRLHKYLDLSWECSTPGLKGWLMTTYGQVLRKR